MSHRLAVFLFAATLAPAASSADLLYRPPRNASASSGSRRFGRLHRLLDAAPSGYSEPRDAILLAPAPDAAENHSGNSLASGADIAGEDVLVGAGRVQRKLSTETVSAAGSPYTTRRRFAGIWLETFVQQDSVRTKMGMLMIMWVVVAAVAFMALIGFMAFVGIPQDTDAHKAFKMTGDEDCAPSAQSEQHELYAIGMDALVSDLGLSAFAFLDFESTGLTLLPIRASVLLLVLQKWSLQVAIFYVTWLYTMRQAARQVEHSDALSIGVYVAVYLHFLACMGNMPLSTMLIRYAHHFHCTARDRALALMILVGDGLFIPCCLLTIGSLLLCTSSSVMEVLLNSCAIVFLGTIDNWIIAVHSKLTDMTGAVEPATLYFPVNTKHVRMIGLLISVFPVVPIGGTMLIYHVGLQVLEAP